TEAAYGCLKPPPTGRLRRANLHLSYSMTLSRLIDTMPLGDLTRISGEEERCSLPSRTLQWSKEFRWDVEWHRILPAAVGEHAFAAAIRVHDEDLAVLLEGVVVERRFVAEAVHAAAPHDPAVRGPDGVAVGRSVGGDPQ